MFNDRTDAGLALARELTHHKDDDVLVLAIPTGGIEPGRCIAQALNAELSLLVTRKLASPENPESGFGAVTEDGGIYLISDADSTYAVEEIEAAVAVQRGEAKRRIDVLRNGENLPRIAGRTVILVDDGIAMGSTMLASIALCRARNAGRIVVAAPVASPRIISALTKFSDEVLVLETPWNFRAVAQAYAHWHDVTDQEALATLKCWERDRSQFASE